MSVYTSFLELLGIKPKEDVLKEKQQLKEAVSNLHGQLEKANKALKELEILKKDFCKLIKEKESLLSKIEEAESFLDTLRHENDSLKKELANQSANLKDIVDNVIYCLQHSEFLEDDSYEKKEVIGFFNKHIEQILAKVGIEVFEDVEGPVNPVFHKIVASANTDIAAQKGTISRSLGKGFRIGDKCVVEQLVEIYV